MKNLVSQRLGWNRNASSSATGCMRLAGLLAAAASASYVPTVVAQGDNLILEEIVVTVRRRVEMEQDVPISMKAMDANFIRQTNITKLSDLGTKVPAVRISNAGTSTQEPIVTIRGQRPTDTTLGLDQAAPVYLNEVVMTPSQGGNLGFYDLENIQILKGPQGTLFGRNSTGGAILVTTKRPGVDFGGYGQLEVGTYNLRTFEGAVDLPVNDTMQFRVAGRMVKRDGYQDNVANNALAGDEKYWDEDSGALRVTMNLDLDALTNLAILSYSEDDAKAQVPVIQGWNPQAQAAASTYGLLHNQFSGTHIDDAVARQQDRDPWEVETDIDGVERVVNVNFANITEIELTDEMSFKSVLGYRKVHYGLANNADGTALPLFGAPTPEASANPGSTTFTGTGYEVDYSGNITRDPEEQATDGEQYSLELQLFGEAFDGGLEWISGLYAYKMDASVGGRASITGAIPGYGPTVTGFPVFGGSALDAFAASGLNQENPKGDVKNKAYGIFGEATYIFTDQLSVTLGLRQTWDDREVTVRHTRGVGTNLGCSVTVAGDPATIDPDCARTEDEKFSSPTGRVSFNYTPLEGMLAYFSVSTGYKAGGFNLRGTTDETLEPFDEETVITYEVGHKADWGLLGYAPVRTNIALYWQDYDDIQKTQGFQDPTTGDFGTNTVNAAEAVIRGVEFDVTWALTESLRTSFAYAWTDAYYKSWELDITTNTNWLNPAGSTLRTIDVSDGDFTYVPETTATWSVSYDLPVPLSVGEMTLNLIGYWQSGMATHPTGNHFDREYAEFNAWTDASVKAAQDTVDVDSYDVWNLRFDWLNMFDTSIDTALWVNNVTDEEYIVGGLNIIDTLGIAAATYGAPRTIGLSARYSF